MAIFKGAGVAIVTPMNEDGSVNYEKFGELIEFQIANGTDAIIVCGTTGESSTLTHEEHLDTIKYCVDKVAKRIPVVAGTGSNCTDTAVYLSQEAEKYGVDGILLVSPYYNKATQKGLYRHFKTVADSVKVPAILYNVPSRTGCNILPETVVKLCKDVENIVGIKEASGNISQIAHLAAIGQGVVDIYSGNDDQIVPLLSVGGKGVISVLANVAPQYTHDICAKFFEGDVKGSCKMQLDAIPLIEKLFCEVNPIPVKKALNLMGWQAGPLRMPLTEMTEAHTAQLAKELENYDIYVKQNSISTWELGTATPNARQFLVLCEILEIYDIYTDFIGQSPLNPFRNLNETGMNKVLEYIRDLESTGNYKPADIIPIHVIRERKVFYNTVSAGTGSFLDSDEYEMISSPDIPEAATFGVYVDGDSMEPRYHNKDLIWIEQTACLDDGEIGIFYLDRNAYVKKFQNNRLGTYLISLNKKYDPIPVTENSSFKIFGRVLS